MVAVAVVSFNTRELLLRCLKSFEPAVEAGHALVWVVDNGSTDGSPESARQSSPWATVIEPGENLGFGRAVNLVADRTQSTWLLAANADTALTPGALATLLRAGEDPRVGCVAPRLVLADGSSQHSVHPLPTLRFTVAFNLGLHRLDRTLGDRLCLEGFWDADRPRPVPWAIGACLLLRRSAFEQVGGFDQRQWLYAEDLDLGWRLHQRGWATWYEPRALVLHESGAATGAAFGAQRRTRYMAATYVALARRRGSLRTWATGLVNVAGAAARVAWMTPLAFTSSRWRALRADNHGWLRAHMDGLRELRAGPPSGP